MLEFPRPRFPIETSTSRDEITVGRTIIKDPIKPPRISISGTTDIHTRELELGEQRRPPLSKALVGQITATQLRLS